MIKLILTLLFMVFAQGYSAVLAQNGQTSPFPDNLEPDLSAGASAIYLLDFRSAQEHFKHAIDLAPDHPAAYFFELMLTWYRLTYDSLANRNPVLEKLLESQAELTVEKAGTFSE